jgi:PBP1b-binding outer membrane lipoprotein LpoB
MYTKLLNFIIILLGAAFLFSGCQKGGGEEESESFKKNPSKNMDKSLKERLRNLIKIPKSGGHPHQNHQKEHRM